MTKREPSPRQPEQGNPLPLEYEMRPRRDGRLTLAQWFAIAPLALAFAAVPIFVATEGNAAFQVVDWALTALFVGLVFVSALNLFTWSRDRWVSAPSHERTTAVAVCAVLVFHTMCIVIALLQGVT